MSLIIKCDAVVAGSCRATIKFISHELLRLISQACAGSLRLYQPEEEAAAALLHWNLTNHIAKKIVWKLKKLLVSGFFGDL